MELKIFRFIIFSFLLVIFSFALHAQDDWYYNKPIKDIIFSGLRNFQISELEGLMLPYKDRLFTDDLFSEIFGKLYALEYFENIEPATIRADSAGTEVILRFSVTERPIVRRINFIGNSNIRRYELNEAITTKVSDVFNQTKLRYDTEVIIQKYIEKGYPNVSVTVDESYAPDGVTINFRITESEKISIIRIDFQGNFRFTANTLRNQLSLKARTLLNDGAFSEAKLIEDRLAVEKYYHDRGFIDAVVRDVTRTYGSDDKGTNLILSFMIEEGDEYRFGGITFTGNQIFSTEQLNRLITSKEGELVNASRLEMDLQRVAELYFENGYIFNSMNRIPDKNPQRGTISYTFEIVERSRAYIENLIVIGNEKTRTDVILREIPLEPGDVFSRTKVMDAVRNLYNTQFFSLVLPDMLPGSAENLMDLVFTMEEQMTTSIQFGLTFSGSADPETFPISGLFEWTDKNVAGSGNELGMRFSSSVVDSHEISVNYLHRWIFGLPLSLGSDFSATFSRRLAAMETSGIWKGDEPYSFPDGFESWEEYNKYDKQPSREYLMRYDQWYVSLGLSTGYRWLTPIGIVGLNGGFRFGIIRNTFDNKFRPYDDVLRDGNNKWTPKNSFWFSFAVDQRDIFYDPNKGYYFNQRAGVYGFFNNEIEHYLRTDTKAQYFHTLFDFPVKWSERWSFKCVLAIHAGISFLFQQPWRNPDDFRIEEANQLSVDGMFTGRGWSNQYRYKGYLLLDSWIELRIPIVRGILAWDFFFDMAGVESKPGYYFGKDDTGKQNFTIDNLKFSYGGGIRFTMPQFPIRLSLAKRFDFENGQFRWQKGGLFGSNKPGEEWKGMDLVVSFALSY